MKKIFFFIFLLFNIANAQIGFVEYYNPVYKFLERMSSRHLIDDYNSFVIPKTRTEIAGHLSSLIPKRNNLNEIDNEIFSDLLVEFQYDITGSTKYLESKITDFQFSNLISDREKYLYSYTDTNDVSIFMNLEGSIENIFYKNNELGKSYNSFLGVMGGSIRASFLNKIGFYIRATNGIVKGDKEAARFKDQLNRNYKFNEFQTDQATYFDETEGYLLADFDYVKFSIGRNRNILGYGIEKSILSNSAPMMDQLGLQINYKFLSFTWMHAKILGPQNAYSDSTFGTIRTITDKYFVTHRLAFDLGRHLSFGFGENIIYADRSVDFSYLNPFNFYKTVEHENKDRDNSQIFFDAVNNSIKGLKLYTEIIIDDIDFSKLGTGWYGNQALINLAAYSTQLNDIIPIDFKMQYLRIDPYFYSHRLAKNNFTNDDVPLGSSIEPNSESFIFEINYRPYYRLDLSLNFRYTNHGANELNEEGTILVNHGGDILFGHRSFDSINAGLLEGVKEVKRVFSFEGVYEPINNYFVRLNVKYINNDLQNNIRVNDLFTSVYLFVKI
ncbi:MAG: hypothetical protein HND52_01280 [Ignavibacteriae bacterium]|nr:hypothetical protein [Ignavibacteriota bacterium]NOG96581.1 hypothetical protein [Ignavibacteriota bacterium]